MGLGIGLVITAIIDIEVIEEATSVRRRVRVPRVQRQRHIHRTSPLIPESEQTVIPFVSIVHMRSDRNICVF